MSALPALLRAGEAAEARAAAAAATRARALASASCDALTGARLLAAALSNARSFAGSAGERSAASAGLAVLSRKDGSARASAKQAAVALEFARSLHLASRRRREAVEELVRARAGAAARARERRREAELDDAPRSCPEGPWSWG